MHLDSSVQGPYSQEIRRQIQEAIGEYNELLTMVKKHKLRCFGHSSRSSGKDDSNGHSERKKMKMKTEEVVGRQY